VPDDDDCGGSGTGSPGGCEMPTVRHTGPRPCRIIYPAAGFASAAGAAAAVQRAQRGYDTQTTKYDGTLEAAIAVPRSRARQKRHQPLRSVAAVAASIAARAQ